jgi:DNA sulfur modification protein DndC
MFEAPGLGWNTSLLATVYGQSEDPNIDPPDTRTGCIGCPLVKRDTALENIVKLPEYKYLTPLLEVRQIWEEAREFKNRHRHYGEKLKDGRLSSKPCRVGCLTLDARERLLAKMRKIQDRINRDAIASDKQTVDLINDEERDRILWHIKNKTYPQGWTGKEPRGDKLLPTIFSNGTMQPLLWGDHSPASPP